MQFSYDASKAQFYQSLWQYVRANFFKEPHPLNLAVTVRAASQIQVLGIKMLLADFVAWLDCSSSKVRCRFNS